MPEEVNKFLKQAADAGIEGPAAAKYKELRGRRAKELELWKTWNDGGRKATHLEPLLKSIDPIITNETRKRFQGLGGSIPQAALKNQLRNHAVSALESYNPSRGTQLTTHIMNNFKRVTDFVAANRNPKYMPRTDVERYGTFHNARVEFSEEHGRDPTPEEMQGLLPNWSVKTIKKFQKGFGSEAYTEVSGTLEHDVGSTGPTPRAAFMLMRSTLTPDEEQFADMHYPAPGEPQKSVSAIAKALKLPAHRVYRIKANVEKKLGKVLKNE